VTLALNRARRHAPLRAEGGPPRIVNVHLDPPTARVPDVVDFRSSLIGGRDVKAGELQAAE